MKARRLFDVNTIVEQTPAIVFNIIRFRSKLETTCKYCRTTIEPGSTVYRETTYNQDGCCHACAVSASRLLRKPVANIPNWMK